MVTSVSHLPRARGVEICKDDREGGGEGRGKGRGGEGEGRLGRYWPPRKRPKSRFFGDDIGLRLVSWLEVDEKIGFPSQFFVWLRPNFEMTDATAFKAKKKGSNEV